MSFSLSQSLNRMRLGINLPLQGWPLVILLLAWLLAGTIGHDPWKSEDAIHLGIAYRMLTSGHWLMPSLAGDPYIAPPFYYWLAALFGKLISTIPNWLPPHDAMRLASTACLGVAFYYIYRTARIFMEAELAAAAPFMLAGSLGLLVVGHEAQPVLVVLAAYCAGFYALAILPRHSIRGALTLGFAIAISLLTASVVLVLPLALMAILSPLFYPSVEHRWRALASLGLTFFVVLLVAAPWFAKVSAVAPDFLKAWKEAELARLSLPYSEVGKNLLAHLSQLPWFAWPAFPFVLWSLWLIVRKKCQCLNGASPGVRIPLLAFLLTWLVVGSFYSDRSPAAILILPSVAMLALPGLAQVKRGAANAFDWLSMMTFSLLIIFAWLGWSGIYFGWPEQLAIRSQRFQPGFNALFASQALLMAIIAFSATLVWIWLIMSRQRSPLRGIVHWMAGITIFWLSIATLWLPWINHGKSYRSVANEVATTLSGEQGCLASVGLSDAQRASFDYFGLATQQMEKPPADAKGCQLLLVFQTGMNPAEEIEGWKMFWQGARPGDVAEHFRLYRRLPPPPPKTGKTKSNA